MEDAMAAPDSNRQRLKDEFIANRGYWAPLWDSVLEVSPEYFEAYMKLSSVPWKTGTLEPKVREFIYIAIDTATTHLHVQGTRVHMQNAIRYGATQGELMEVLQLTSVLGVHTMTMGLPALVDVMRKLGRSDEIESGSLTPRQEKMKADWIAARGFWAELPEYMLRFSPDFFESYVELSSVPWKHGTLEPKVRELIYVAIDASTTHLYEAGTRIHMENALRHGATPSEIVEVLALVSVLGVHTIAMGVPVMLEELAKAKRA
jgi:alkylhydroperoxidase/carboxymuconolactone decarboxylase family protein YurZ